MNTVMINLARWVAIIGGVILISLILVTSVSVIGRSLNTIGHLQWLETNMPFAALSFQMLGSINGDFEIVEIGVAIAIVAFFPWCSMMRNHATVDVFTSGLPVQANRIIDLVWEIVFTIVLFALSWRLFVGTSDKMRYGETTFLRELPVWWGYLACAILMGLASLVSVYVIWVRISEIRNSANDMQNENGSE